MIISMAKFNDKIFADSNFFIALFNPQDSLHQKAFKVVQRLQKENPQLYISNFIFLEIVTVLTQRASRKVAVSFGSHLLEDGKLKIIHVDQRLNKMSWEIFKEIGRKNVSFVDSSILAVMRTEGINKLLTFDEQDFATLKRKYRFSFYA